MTERQSAVALNYKVRIPIFYKIMLSFLGLLIGLLLILSLSSYIARKNAQDYFRQSMEDRYENLVQELNEVIEAQGWQMTDDGLIHYIRNYATRHELRFEIYDNWGSLIFSNMKLNEPGFSEQMDAPVKTFDGWQPEITIEKFQLYDSEGTIGYVKVEFFNAEMMSQNDLNFFDMISGVFQYAIIATFILTVMVSFWIARSIKIPLGKMSVTARAISRGDLKARADIDSSTTEVIQLGESINDLAMTLEREDALRKQLTSDMAHEIRTPLTALKNFFEAFMDGIYEPNEDNMSKCHVELLRIADLVERLKDLASIEETNLTSNRESLDIGDEIATMCDLLKPEFDKKAIAVEVLCDNPVPVMMDKNHLRQIIGNLLTNACRYTDMGGKVLVTTRRTGSEVFFSVKDNGIGIARADQDNIFERFYRVDKSRDRATGGMGVGLTIVKGLVETYSGCIVLDSELGEGAEFIVTIPM